MHDDWNSVNTKIILDPCNLTYNTFFDCFQTTKAVFVNNLTVKLNRLFCVNVQGHRTALAVAFCHDNLLVQRGQVWQLGGSVVVWWWFGIVAVW